MSDPVKLYKCPSCGSTLTFDSKSQKLHCSHCDTYIDVDAMNAYEETGSSEDSTPQWDTSAFQKEWADDEQSSMHQYNCPSCGAVLVTDATTTASVCAYCGSPVVLSDKLTGTQRPDYVIPFKIDKETAKKALKSFYKGKILLPKTFTADSNFEDIQGIYVPFWLYSCKVDCSYSFDATRSRHYVEGDYDVTETMHYLVVREGKTQFSKIPVDGSSKMEDSYMDAIEPFDYSLLTAFQTDYLPGYAAMTYDETASDCSQRANTRIMNTTTDAIRATCSYESLVQRSGRILTTDNTVEYALMPVWMLTTKWKGKQYRFAMNGQSGRLIGDLPIDPLRFIGLLTAITVPLGILLKIFVF